MYKLTTNTIFENPAPVRAGYDRCHNKAIPVLIGTDGVTGPWDRNSTLPHVPKRAIAYDYVKRYFLNSPLATDVGLCCDAGKNLHAECLAYLTARDRNPRHRAELIAEAKKHGIEIPEPV